MAETPENLGWWNALVIAFGMPVKVQAILIRVAWVGAVSFAILRVCGWLAFLGIPSPLVMAADVAQDRHTQAVVAQIVIGGELSKAIAACRRERDPETRDRESRYIESLRSEYKSVTGIDYPERCQ